MTAQISLLTIQSARYIGRKPKPYNNFPFGTERRKFPYHLGNLPVFIKVKKIGQH